MPFGISKVYFKKLTLTNGNRLPDLRTVAEEDDFSKWPSIQCLLVFDGEMSIQERRYEHTNDLMHLST